MAVNQYLARSAKRIFRWYALSGTELLTKEDRGSVIFFAVVAFASVLSIWAWMVFYLYYDAQTYWPAAAVCASFSATLLAPIIGKRSRFAAELFSIFMVCWLMASLAYMFGAKAGLNLGLLVLTLLLMMECGTKRRVTLATAIIVPLFLFAALPFWFPEPRVFTDVSPELLSGIFMANVGNLVSLVVICMLVTLRRAEIAEAAFAREFDRSETLLSNLLPGEIAARLKERPGEVIADGLPAVTMLFADIVDFTPRAAKMKPDDLVGFLNQIFSRFDVLTAERGLEKIKTIGDAYMVAAGLPVAREDHAAIVADMAFAMQSAVQDLSVKMGEQVQLRIGIHSGPAIAGVIGTSKVFYDVWGDTVNTASRMESHGEPGRIQVTAATKAVLGDTFACAPRGPVEIKGIGVITTFWLVGRA